MTVKTKPRHVVSTAWRFDGYPVDDFAAAFLAYDWRTWTARNSEQTVSGSLTLAEAEQLYADLGRAIAAAKAEAEVAA